MAYLAPLRQSLLPLLLIVSLSSCSTDAFDVDDGARVSAIRPPRQVRNLPIANSQPAYPVDSSMEAASPPNDMQPVVQQQAQRLPMIDSDEAMSLQGSTPDGSYASSGQPRELGAPPRVLGQLHSVPQMNPSPVEVASTGMGDPNNQGVSMDDGLGVSGSGTSLAQEEANSIAETNTQEPVVGGIGTDNPVSYSQPRVQQVEDPLQSELDNYPQAAPRARRQSYPVGQQVAMLPRPIDPLAGPAAPPRGNVMPASEASCRMALRKMGVKFQDVAPISNGPTCGIPYPIKVYGFASNIAMKPSVTLNCQVTLAFAEWVKNELNPSARYRYWSGIKAIVPLGGYSCRRMNSSARNPWSEHARGNAIDVGKFVLNSGKTIDVRKPGFFSFREKGLLKAVRSESCKYFDTVLGPGSDPHHKDHFHFDLRHRKSGYRHCD